MFPTIPRAIRQSPFRCGPSQPNQPGFERRRVASGLCSIFAGIVLALLLGQPLLVWGAPTLASARPPAYRLAVFPWDLFDHAPHYSDIIVTVMNEVIQATGLFDVTFSYYRDQHSHPDVIRKLSRSHKKIWHKTHWYSPREPNVDGISELAKDLNVDAVLLYYADLAFGMQAQDTLKAFLIDIHSRKIYQVTGYTGDFSLGEGYREITNMTNQILAAYQSDNPVDVIIVKQNQLQQVPTQLAQDTALAALERQKRATEQQATHRAELKRQEEGQQRLAEEQRLAKLNQQQEEQQLADAERMGRQEKAAKLAELQHQQEWQQKPQSTRDTVPPIIRLTSHAVDQVVPAAAATSRIQVTGKVDDASGVAEVTVNGVVARLDQNGNFEIEVLLRIGDNPVTVSAVDVHANTAEARFLVQRDMSAMVASNLGNATRQKVASARETTAPTVLLTSHNITRSARVLVSTPKITLIGQAVDDNGVVEVSVNDDIANLDHEGNFSKSLRLKVGDNRITITAMDVYANVAKLQFIIQRQTYDTALAERMIKRYNVGQYYAMIVGNNNYRYLPKLETAVKDATEVDTLLRTKYGFKTKLLLDATRSGILSTLSQMRQTMLPDDNLLVYYAGHGVFEKVAQEAYWLPVDAQEDDVANWIIADSITSEMKRIPARHVLIVADSCYSGTLTRSANVNLQAKRRERAYFLKKMVQKSSRTLMASGGNEPVVDSGSDGHSVFAATFLRALAEIDESVFTAEEIFYKFVKQSVAGQADQTPVYNIIQNSGHNGGDFVFIKR